MPTRHDIDKIRAFIRDHYRQMSDSEIARRFNVRRQYIGQLRRKMNLSVSSRTKLARRESARAQSLSKVRHPEDAVIKKLYLTVSVSSLALKIGRSETFVKTRLKNLGLKIPKRIIEQRKRDSQIKKGSIPPNKGKRIHEYMSADAIKRSAKTRFKKGNKPHNTKFDGAITIRHSHKNRNMPPYAWIRTGEGKWQMLHVWLWRKEKGKVKRGHIIVFKDKNTMNVDINNLEMISLKENMKRNTIHNMPPELKNISMLIGRLTRKMNKYANKEQN